MLLQPLEASILGLATHCGRQLVVLASEAQASTSKRPLAALSICHVKCQGKGIELRYLSQTGICKVPPQADKHVQKDHSPAQASWARLLSEACVMAQFTGSWLNIVDFQQHNQDVVCQVLDLTPLICRHCLPICADERWHSLDESCLEGHDEPSVDDDRCSLVTWFLHAACRQMDMAVSTSLVLAVVNLPNWQCRPGVHSWTCDCVL